MLKGVLESKGISVSEKRISESLERVAPLQFDQRRNDTMDRTNPLPYSALSFGHKLHVDQNEKLKMFGVTHIIARDGYSGKIISYCTMPVKNNLAIYDGILRYVQNNFTIVYYYSHSCFLSDHRLAPMGFGSKYALTMEKEFYLLLYVQEALRCHFGPRDVLPYVQSPSTEVRLNFLRLTRIILYTVTLYKTILWNVFG